MRVFLVSSGGHRQFQEGWKRDRHDADGFLPRRKLVLYFTAGINGESDGLFGVLEAATKKVKPRQ
jgi:hypothetical protein